MAVAEEYILKFGRKREYRTSKTGSDYIYIDKSNFVKMINNVYHSGYIKCRNDENAKYKESLNSSTQQGGYDMDTDRILERIDKLDNKYNDRIDNLNNKLDDVINNLNNNFNNLNREVGEINTKVDDIKENNGFKSKYIIAPIITSIITSAITALLMKVFLK